MFTMHTNLMWYTFIRSYPESYKYLRDVKASCLWHRSPHWLPGLIWLISLARQVLPPHRHPHPSLLLVRPSGSCTLFGRGGPSPIEERSVLQSRVYDICSPLLEPPNSSQDQFIGESRVVKLPRLQAHPSEVMHVAVCSSLKINQLINE